MSLPSAQAAVPIPGGDRQAGASGLRSRLRDLIVL